MKIVGDRVVNEGAIVSCSQGTRLAQQVAERLSLPHIAGDLIDFTNNEIKTKPGQSISAYDVLFTIQGFDSNLHTSIWELFVMLDALRRAHAQQTFVCLSIVPYARQDTVASPREPVTARLFLEILEKVSQMYSLITIMLHSRQIMGFVKCPLDNLTMRPQFVREFQSRVGSKDVLVVAPDAGAEPESKKFARDLGTDQTVLPKTRTGVNQVQHTDIPLDTGGRPFLIIDDMVDGGGTVEGAVQMLERKGSKNAQRFLIVTHPILSPNHSDESKDPIQRINRCGFNEIFFADTVTIPPDRLSRFDRKPIIVPAAEVLSVAIDCRLNHRPLPDLHKYERGYS